MHTLPSRNGSGMFAASTRQTIEELGIGIQASLDELWGRLRPHDRRERQFLAAAIQVQQDALAQSGIPKDTRRAMTEVLWYMQQLARMDEQENALHERLPLVRAQAKAELED